MGVMSGTLDLVQRIYLGVDVRDGVVYFEPRLIDRLDGLSLPMQFRGTPIRVTHRGRRAHGRRRSPTASARRIRVGVGEDVRELGAGRALRVHRRGARRARGRGRDARCRGFRGAIFDVDGVLVDTPHERAWRDTLQELMDAEWSDIRGETSYSPQRFTPEVYRQVIAGRPRMSGARAALTTSTCPTRSAAPRPTHGRKQQKVVALIEAGEFSAFDDALRFVLALRGAGIRMAAASSSKNAALVLEQVRLGPGLTLLDALDADVSGRDLAHGKPHPEIFLVAARELGLPPRECFVVEDAVSGIQAAKAGAMAALGVARADDVELLTDAGADLVVTSLDDVDIDRLSAGRLAAGAAR